MAKQANDTPRNSRFAVKPPKPGEQVAPAQPSEETLRLLLRRRSVVANNMTGPGPSDAQIKQILLTAIRVPDHGKLAPWRFIVFKGPARKDFGTVLRKAFLETNPSAPEARLSLEEHRFTRAPVVVAVVSRVTENHKIPVWEQQLSAGAVCQSMLIATNAMGFASQWITEWYAYDPTIKIAMGLNPGERIAGFVYMGSTDQPCLERERPSAPDLTTHWRARI